MCSSKKYIFNSNDGFFSKYQVKLNFNVLFAVVLIVVLYRCCYLIC